VAPSGFRPERNLASRRPRPLSRRARPRRRGGSAPVVIAGLVLGETRRRGCAGLDRLRGDHRGTVSKIGFGLGVPRLDWGMLRPACRRVPARYVNVLSSGASSPQQRITLARAGGFDFYGGYVTVAHRARASRCGFGRSGVVGWWPTTS
jgi:hypothetical protein